MTRFFALAIPLALLVFALGGMLFAALGLAPDVGPLAARGIARPEGLPWTIDLAARALEAAGIVALTLLLSGRMANWVLDGLTVGLVAWLFRGPLLVLGVASLTRIPVAPFWQLARGALLLDLVAGLVLAAFARAALAGER
ncbi:MAG: hypothetical protein AB7G12_01840 [Thermoanaerobaculia bacterium]